MKINLIVNSFPTPSETFLFNLVVGLESKGVDVTVIASSPSTYTNFYKHRLHEWSGKIKYIPGKSLYNLIKWILVLIKHSKLFYKLTKKVGYKKAINLCLVYNTILQNNPDIVHFSFSGIAIQYQYIIEDINKQTKTVVSCRGTGEKVKPVVDNTRALELSSTLNKIHLIHCVSEDMLNTIARYANIYDKSFVNYPSIQTAMFSVKEPQINSHREVFQIVTTGRLYYQKGYLFALEALLKLKNEGYQFQYHILGEGPDREMLEYVIYDMKLNDYAILHGRVDGAQVKKFLTMSDIFLLPSIYEGISNAALEAMCTGVPIITTTAGGMSEVITDGVNGRIVPTYNSQAIYEAIKWSFHNYEKSIQMAQNARVHVELKHSHENQIKLFLNHYTKLVNDYNRSL
jgi:glycosyltransferase involved in cell wall biosynthesis